MNRTRTWLRKALIFLVVALILAAVANRDPETALGISACILAVYVGRGIRRLLRWKKGNSSDAQNVVLGQAMANNPLEDVFDSDRIDL